MHLVQDISVPEHTRNDGHYFSYDYEVWAKGKKVNDYSSINFVPNDAFPLSLNNLFDTNQYNGANPGITTQPAIGLSEYSNANFLSPDSIFTRYQYPAYTSVIPNKVLDSGGVNKLYLKKVGNGDDVEFLARALKFYRYLPEDHKKLALTLDDPEVYDSYAEKLIPRAIGYSSQVLSYFFRGQLDVEMSEGILKIKNASNETIVGGNANNKFELYYDNADDVRTLLTSVQADTLEPGAEQTITFSAQQDATSYMLAYKGQLGSEPDAVIGKYIPVSKNEYYMINNFESLTADYIWDMEEPEDFYSYLDGSYLVTDSRFGNYALHAGELQYEYWPDSSANRDFDTPMTLEYWFKVTVATPTPIDAYFNLAWSNSTKNGVFQLLIYGDTWAPGELSFVRYIRDLDDNKLVDDETYTIPFSYYEWHHFALVVTDNKLRYYFDGIMHTEFTSPSPTGFKSRGGYPYSDAWVFIDTSNFSGTNGTGGLEVIIDAWSLSRYEKYAGNFTPPTYPPSP
jgi:hypothetical protein